MDVSTVNNLMTTLLDLGFGDFGDKLSEGACTISRAQVTLDLVRLVDPSGQVYRAAEQELVIAKSQFLSFAQMAACVLTGGYKDEVDMCDVFQQWAKEAALDFETDLWFGVAGELKERYGQPLPGETEEGEKPEPTPGPTFTEGPTFSQEFLGWVIQNFAGRLPTVSLTVSDLKRLQGEWLRSRVV